MTTTKCPLPLRLTPFAWAKLLRLRDRGDTEVGGFGVSSSQDLLLVEDICLIRQRCSQVTVEFDDGAVADFFDRQVDRGLAPERFARIWIHTHPGNSPHPSATDEDTFARCFGSCDWAVMFILARGGETYARLRFKAGPGGSLDLLVQIAYEQPFGASNWADWDAEYAQSVTAEPVLVEPRPKQHRRGSALARESREPVVDAWWSRALREDVPRLTDRYDDGFLPQSFPEPDDDYNGAPF